MTNISHLEHSENLFERAAFWLAHLSWDSSPNFEILQELSKELQNRAVMANAAPDLLEACEMAYKHLGAPYQVARDDDACMQLQNAIAKVTIDTQAE